MLQTISDEIEEFLKDVEAVVEATRTEYQLLWETTSKEYVDFFHPNDKMAYEYIRRYTWSETRNGYWTKVNKNTEKPVCIALSKSMIDGIVVLFYHPTSIYVNHRKIEKWLDKYIPRTVASRTDVSNFDHIRHAKKRSDTKSNQAPVTEATVTSN